MPTTTATRPPPPHRPTPLHPLTPPPTTRYDSHREQILRSGERHQAGASAGGEGAPQRPPDEEDLFAFFSSAAYAGFGDGPGVSGAPFGVQIFIGGVRWSSEHAWEHAVLV